MPVSWEGRVAKRPRSNWRRLAGPRRQCKKGLGHERDAHVSVVGELVGDAHEQVLHVKELQGGGDAEVGGSSGGGEQERPCVALNDRGERLADLVQTEGPVRGGVVPDAHGAGHSCREARQPQACA